MLSCWPAAADTPAGWIRGAVRVAAAGAAVLLVAGCGSGGHQPVKAAPTAVPYVVQPGAPALSTEQPPWPLPADARPLVAAAGLAALPKETLAVHYHAHLGVIVLGVPVPVPADIGIVYDGGKPTGITSLHTHDTTGILHVEAAQDVPFTLGQLTTEWGVRLSRDCLGGLCAGGGRTLRVFVDGVAVNGDPAALVLRPQQEIALVYGPADSTDQVPSSYEFPAGL